MANDYSVQACGVLNLEKQKFLATDCEVADSAWARMKGLLGRGEEEFLPGRGLWLVPANSIHTIGMSFPIDVAYLDRDSRVIKVYHRLSPFRVAAIMFKAHSILELPAGILEKTQTVVGDVIEFREVASH